MSNPISNLTLPNHLPHAVCDDIVLRFERDPRKAKGLVNNKVLNENIKSSMELSISAYEEWKDIDTLLFDSLKSGYQKYIDHLSRTNNKIPLFTDIRDRGYTIEKYPANSGFHQWHTDFGVYSENPSNIECRIASFKWFLTESHLDGMNSLEGQYGKGTLLFYPSTWTTVCEVPRQSTDQYHISGFMVVNIN
jgi:hypothetical protein